MRAIVERSKKLISGAVASVTREMSISREQSIAELKDLQACLESEAEELDMRIDALEAELMDEEE